MTDEQTRNRLEAANWRLRAWPGFIEQAGPLWTRREDAGWAYGVLCGARHLNPLGRVHGGALATLLDHTISMAAWEACEREPCVTVQLDTQFLGAVHEGQFVEARAQLSHRTGGLVFVRGALECEGQPVLMAQAILKILPAAR